MKPESKVAGFMVHSFRALSDDEYEATKVINPNTHKYACEFLEYGEGKEGYWICYCSDESSNWDCEIEYLKEDGCCNVCVLITAAAMLPWLTIFLKVIVVKCETILCSCHV